MEERVRSDEIDQDIDSKLTTERNFGPDYDYDYDIDRKATNRIHNERNLRPDKIDSESDQDVDSKLTTERNLGTKPTNEIHHDDYIVDQPGYL